MDIASVSTFLILGLLPLCGMAYFFGSKKSLSEGFYLGGKHIHAASYGWYAVVWTLSPAVGASVFAAILGLSGVILVPQTAFIVFALVAASAGLWAGVRKISPSLRARTAVEKTIVRLLFIASLVSIFTTVGIVLSIIFEAIKFFEVVSLWDFVFGATWNPDTAFLEAAGRGGESAADPKFGSVPLFAGTFMITAIAMLVALPVGLFSAICMSEYASPAFRKVAKPTLEILAGIPTVVYGFFAAITVSPLVVNCAEILGLEADYTNALTPGLVMGIMIIPLISSLSDEVIGAVPQAMREGALALGAYPSEVITTVVLPAALPGLVSAFLLGVSRAVGETMIVVMAAGLRPNLTWNPLEGMTTVTVRIVDALTGDQAFDSPETLAAFGLGLVLLVATLLLNIISLVVIRKFRQRYE